MEMDIKVRKVTQDVFLYNCFKHKITMEEPSPVLYFTPEIKNKLVNNLSVFVWIHSHRNLYRWRHFFEKHFERMTSSPELFAKYVYFACCRSNSYADAYRRFTETFSVVMYFGLSCWSEGRKEFLNTCVHLFCTCFEKDFRLQFEEQGGFRSLTEYLDKEFKLKKHMYQVKNINCLFKYFQDPKYEQENVIIQLFSQHSLILATFSQEEVETDKEVISFVKLVADEVRELCKQTFEEILIDFRKTELQVQELYEKSIGEASGLMSSKAEHFPPQSENKLKKKKSEGHTVITSDAQVIVDSDNTNSEDIGTSKSASSQLSLNLKKSETVRKLLNDMSMDMSKLSDFIQSLCQQHGVPRSKINGNRQ